MILSRLPNLWHKHLIEEKKIIITIAEKMTSQVQVSDCNNFSKNDQYL